MPFSHKNLFTRFPTLPTLVTLAAGGEVLGLLAAGSEESKSEETSIVTIVFKVICKFSIFVYS